ncbi:MAG: nucleotidyltransferase domain-containing protein [Cyanobacteria bacterium P01_C01_bin.89]
MPSQPFSTVTSDRLWERLTITRDTLNHLCKSAHIAELALFGSILRDDFRDDSDIDLLVTYLPDAQRGLIEAAQLQHIFERAFNRKVDLISKNGLQHSRNHRRRDDILKSAKVIYVSQPTESQPKLSD